MPADFDFEKQAWSMIDGFDALHRDQKYKSAEMCLAAAYQAGFEAGQASPPTPCAIDRVTDALKLDDDEKQKLVADADLDSEPDVVVCVMGGVADVSINTLGLVVEVRDYDIADETASVEADETASVEEDVDGNKYLCTIYE